MKIIKTLTLIICCLFGTNCATIIHGTRQNIAFSSNPTGAEVSINGESKGKTPVIIKLKRNEDYIVKIQLSGYLPYEINVVKKVDAWIIGNIIFGGLIGLVVDAASGGMYKLSPEQVSAELKRNDGSFIQKGDNIYIGAAMIADPSWVKIGNLKKLGN